MRSSFRSCIVSICAVCVLSSPARAQSTLEQGVFHSDSAELHYAFDRPEGPGPFPVIVLVHGSGRATRDEMLNIVPKFTSRGFAVFRYDKRGVGESTGKFRGVGPITSRTVIPELARDAAAAFATACGARDIDSHKCGFFGASQAGWIIPEAMRIASTAAFGILFSGVTIPVGAQMNFAGPNPTLTSSVDSAYARFPSFTGDPGFDSRPTLATMTVPTLWLMGMKDPLLPNRFAALQLDSLRAAGRPVTIKTYPEYTHSLGPDVWPDIDAFLARFR